MVTLQKGVRNEHVPSTHTNLGSSVLTFLLIQQRVGRDMTKRKSGLFSGQAADIGMGENIPKT